MTGTPEHTDVLVLGGGMAGVSIAHELAADRHVTVLDMEATLAFHTTGRSAAMYLVTYGGPAIRALTVASRATFDEVDALSPLPNLYVGLLDRGDAITALHDEVRDLAPDVELLTADEVAAVQPLLRPDRIANGLLEPSAMAIDVHALHQHYVRGLRERGGVVTVSARVVAAQRDGRAWTVIDATGRAWQAPVVVNAAGAWADEVGAVFGAAGMGLQPRRRSAFMVDAPPGAPGPMFGDVPDSFYVKPEAGQLLCSPADATPQPPHDARPDEVEIARAIEVINELTTLDVRHVRSSWAGLRSFVPDGVPVAGHDPAVEGLFWLAGQGGYGIQTAPALARVAAAVLRGDALPADVAALDVTPGDLAADRQGLTPPRGAPAGPAG